MLPTVPPVTAIPTPVVVAPAHSASRSIKVLHVVNGEHFSGAERVQSHLGRCLPLHGIEADFACLKPGKFFRMVEDHHGQWGKGFAIPMANRFDLRAARRIAELVRAQRYDLLHAHTPRGAMVTAVAATLARVPWVYHVHSPATRDSLRRVLNQVNAWIEKQSLRGCSHLITVSESLRLDCIARGAEKDKVSVVHNGVPAICPPRQSSPTPGGRWTIGMVALMRPRKGLEVVLEALASLVKEDIDLHLRCIGPFETDAYHQQICQRIDRLQLQDRIEQRGFVADVPAALSQLDALVLPSLCGEGLPMVVLEAMAAGLPVVATRVEGTPEAITHGVEGLLAEPGDPASLAEALRSLVSGQVDWPTMADAAQRRHQQYFSDEAMASKTADVYRALLDHA